MSSPAPAAAQPDIGGGVVVSPPAPSPENVDIIPPSSPIVPSPLPSSSPPEIGILPSPLVAPPLPLVVIGATPPIGSTPPPTPTPSLSQPPPQPQPQPQPHLQPQKPETQPPSSSPTPKAKNNPPSFSPPVDNPISATPPPQQTPPSIRSNPVSPSPPLEHPPQAPPSRSSYRRHGAGSYVTEPNPTPRPKAKPKATPLATSPKSSSLPTSAALPSPPPAALPVPQTPDGGTWFPFTAVPPATLPTFPGPPGVVSPATPLLGNNNGASPGNNQNIVAGSNSASGRSNGSSSNFIVGLAVAGILVLLLGAVFAILVVFCRKRGKKFGDDHKSASYKQGSAFTGFQDKTSLPQYTKKDSNKQGNQQVLVNVATPQGPTSNTNGPTLAIAGPNNGVGPALSSGTFTYEELAAATNGFSEQNLLGQGGFGYVLKGVFPNGKEVAVKQLKMGGQQGEREFHAEVETISQVHHKHLVSLLGYCISGTERLLVYEFVPNNTLEFHLHGQGQPVMDWPTRLKIAIGSAKGLAYLHEDCSPTIIHRDIKAANILLDYNFEAKVSDFGLAKIFTSSNSSVTHITTRVVGTFGYLAPEYASSGKVTDKSDVYSYGVMLLELITGRTPICSFGSSSNGSLVNWARPLLTQAIGDGNYETLADPRLQKNYNVDEMASMVACAAACVRLSAWRRPRLSQVVRALEGNLSASELDDGTRPGDSSMHFPYESLDFDARNYIENLKRMAMASNNGYSTSRYSDNTSEFGLMPSALSTDTY